MTDLLVVISKRPALIRDESGPWPSEASAGNSYVGAAVSKDNSLYQSSWTILSTRFRTTCSLTECVPLCVPLKRKNRISIAETRLLAERMELY